MESNFERIKDYAQMMIRDEINKESEKIDNIFEWESIKTITKTLYLLFSEDVKEKYSHIDFENELKKYFENVGLTNSIAESFELENWLEQEIPQRKIVEIVLGYPTRLDGSDSHVTENIRLLKAVLEKKFPGIPVVLFDERFSSKMASAAIAQMGHKKKRQDKSLIDQVAAALILQEYLSQS